MDRPKMKISSVINQPLSWLVATIPPFPGNCNTLLSFANLSLLLSGLTRTTTLTFPFWIPYPTAAPAWSWFCWPMILCKFGLVLLLKGIWRVLVISMHGYLWSPVCQYFRSPGIERKRKAINNLYCTRVFCYKCTLLCKNHVRIAWFYSKMVMCIELI